MKLGFVSLRLSSFLLVFFVEELESNGSETRRSSSSVYGDIDLGSKEFVSKWLGNISEVQLRAEWSSWKLAHQKKYSTSVQDLERYVVWRSNQAYINYGNVDFRYDGQAVTGHFDGHADAKKVKDLGGDMRYWSNQADRPNWLPRQRR